jgi:NTP pyrophosphatase (non-canonical NTP hydrolase)
MPILTVNPKLSDVQRYVAELEVERGFSDQDAITKCLLLGEEIGELFKAVRKQQDLSIDPNSVVDSVANEIADVLVMLCSVANRLNVDIENAFREKEELNKTRVWSGGTSKVSQSG